MNQLLIESRTFIQEFIQHTQDGKNKVQNTILSQFLQILGVTPNVCAILWLKLKEQGTFHFQYKHLL